MFPRPEKNDPTDTDLSMQLNASDSAYWLCPVLVAGSAESEGGMRAAVSMEDIDKSFMGLRCVSR